MAFYSILYHEVKPEAGGLFAVSLTFSIRNECYVRIPHER